MGLTTVSLRGHVLCGDAFLRGDPYEAAREMFIFTQDVLLKPYARAVLFTGPGEDGWHATNDGKHAYVLFWNRPQPVWANAGRLHLLQVGATRKVVSPECFAAPLLA
jgi:hypothetical protein